MSVTTPGSGGIENPEFAIPFTFDLQNGGCVMVEQDSDIDIVNRIWIALSYPQGFLSAIPSFGVIMQVFRKDGVDLGVIEKAIIQWVPEASELIERDPNWFRTLVDTVQVRRDEVTT